MTILSNVLFVCVCVNLSAVKLVAAAPHIKLHAKSSLFLREWSKFTQLLRVTI
jgi:hypothetical protein